MIGTGNVGKALGATLVRAGHEVTMAARDAEKTRQVAAELGARAAATPAEAASAAEVIALAVPFDALDDVAGTIAGQAAGKLVIDPTNPGPATEGGPSAAERLAAKLAGARVAKAFNTLFGRLQANPGMHGTTVDALFATDDDQARPQLIELLRSLGVRPIDAGSLNAARQMEALGWLNIQLQLRHGGHWRSTFVLLGAPAGATSEREAIGARA